MTDYTHTPLKESVAKLLDVITAQIDNTSNPDIEKLAKLAQVVTLQLKTIDALLAHEIREREETERRTFTRFEDLPPPPPEERARMVQILNRHFGVADRDAEARDDPQA